VEAEASPNGDLPILRLEEARVPIESGAAATRPINLSLAAGDFVLIEPGDLARGAEFADTCVGLAAPVTGQVRFLGVDWTQLGAEAAAALRGQIGRLVAASGAWVQSLDMVENVLLPQLHNPRRPLGELRADAARLATRFGLPGLPATRPAQLPPGDLQRAGLVRAFLGRPRLVILERATEGVYPEILDPLVNTIRDARARGAAVLWLTHDARVWTDPGLPTSARHRLLGGRLVSATGRAA